VSLSRWFQAFQPVANPHFTHTISRRPKKDFDISRKQFDSFVKRVEKIRNELAHSQNSIISNIEWSVFVETVSHLEDFLINSDIKVEHIATEGNDFKDLLIANV